MVDNLRATPAAVWSHLPGEVLSQRMRLLSEGSRGGDWGPTSYSSLSSASCTKRNYYWVRPQASGIYPTSTATTPGRGLTSPRDTSMSVAMHIGRTVPKVQPEPAGRRLAAAISRDSLRPHYCAGAKEKSTRRDRDGLQAPQLPVSHES